MTWEAVIGLEFHAQLKTASKIFCGCSTAFGAPPNTNVCPVCMGLPGVLPVLNRAVVDSAIRLGLALECDIAEHTKFDRKQYFYPDLPKNYQISQFDQPICVGGGLGILADGTTRFVHLTRIHMEEDAGKSVHGAADGSQVDFNRTGVPLLEIVTEPDMRTPAEAAAFGAALKAILAYLDVCDCNMEEGSLRCDANVSIRQAGETALGTKTEVKNMNSFKNVQKALEYEIARQMAARDAGERIVQETRLWDAARDRTEPMRSKEEAHDYRFLPDPDLLPLHVDREWVERMRATLPELPAARRARLVADYDIPPYDAEVLTAEKALADFYESTVAAGADAKLASNWIMGEVRRLLNEHDAGIADCKIHPAQLTALIGLVSDETLSGQKAKAVLAEMFESGADPHAIVEAKGLGQISDTGAMTALVHDVIAAHPGPVAEYKAGKTKTMGFLVGQVMKASKGQANPKLAGELLRKALDA